MVLRLFIIAVILVSSIIGYKAWATHRAFTVLHEAPLGNAIGPEDADITLIEIIDYRCSYCRTVHPVVKEFHEKNPDIRIVFRHLPVFGEASLHASQLALAAGMQGRFGEVHNRLMDRSRLVTEDYIEQTAQELELNMEKFKQDLKGPEIGNFLLDTVDATERLGINGTPTFIIGNRILNLTDGLPTVETFENLVRDARH